MLKMLVFSLVMLISSLMILILSLNFMFMNYELIMEWNILSTNSMKMNMILVFSYKTLLYMFLVMFISSMIFFYSIDYMSVNDSLVKRFYYLMSLFLVSMIFLIISPNMLTIMIGWDMLGLTSYCLIIYYSKMNSYNSGMITILLNRLGDLSLMMIISMMLGFGSWNLILYSMNNTVMIMILIMVFTKSAQFPFFVWLPMAMMAPTPVSSLVHSSTLVTAGIYLMVWYGNMISVKYMNFMMLMSSITMFFSGLMANFEMDFKKIIAFSTLSQLGFMLSILSIGLTDLAFLHLFIHALFKSMMFMCVGSYIHSMKGVQNFRLYSGIFYIYPAKGIVMLISLMMLCGFPFLVGFYSKDLMVEFLMSDNVNLLSFTILMISTMLTISYSIRIMFKLMSKNLSLNMLLKTEFGTMIYVMLLMMFFMLIMSKFVYNMNFLTMNLNIPMVYKYFIFKMFIMSYFLSVIFSSSNHGLMLVSMKNFIYMTNMFKLVKAIYIKKSNLNEVMYEKMFNEMISSNVMTFLSMLNYKFMIKVKLSVYSLMFMYMYIALMMIFY